MQNKKDFLASELQMLAKQSIILQKNTLLDKVQAKLDELGAECLKQYPELAKISPNYKVSKGENLKAFPFRVLDFPRHFESEHILAIRTLIWWGKSCTITLHLKGQFLQKALPQLHEIKAYAKEANLKISYSGDEWEHDLEAANYSVFSEKLFASYSKAEFLKIAVALPLDQLNELDHFYRFHFKKLISLTSYGK
jgi:hypothetical protein